jgi:hypothetical protein
VVDCGTIHVGLLEDANEGNGRVYYLRGSHVDTATPTWDEEFVDEVGSVRLDFLYIILNGNGIPTISYTTPDLEVTTASRVAAPGNNSCIAAVSAVSRKIHGGDPTKTFDVNLPLIGTTGIECRKGTPTGKDFQVVFNFPAAVTVGGVSVTSKDGLATADAPVIAGNNVAVNLHNVSNAQTLGITLTNVAHGSEVGNVGVTMSVLLGDVDASGRVDSTDVFRVRQQSLQMANSSNFRTDMDTSARIDSTDVFVTRQQSLTSLP